MFYTLKDKEAIEVEDSVEWAKQFRSLDRCVARDEINEIVITTVFTGVDYNFGSGPPLCFETLIFGGEFNEEMPRYYTWEEAEAGHKAIKTQVLERSKGR